MRQTRITTSYNTYHVQTDFEYADFNSDLGNGWKFDTKAYTTRYWNKQFLSETAATVNLTTAKPSGVDKLNGYRHAGDTAILSWESKWGVFRTGAWYDWAYTDRYQYPSNILSQLDTPLPNFHEHFITQSFQPFAEFEWHPLPRLVITAGIKAADYKMTLNQYQDNGKIVGCLGGTASTYPASTGLFAGAPACIGGAAFVTHSIDYNNWLPTLTARYRVMSALVGLCPVRRGQRHSAERRIRRAGRERSGPAETHVGKELPDWFGNEIQPLDAGCRRLLRSFPERL